MLKKYSPAISIFSQMWNLFIAVAFYFGIVLPKPYGKSLKFRGAFEKEI